MNDQAVPQVLADRTRQDVYDLHQFLLARAEKVQRAHPEASDESRTAWALETAMFAAFYFAGIAFDNEPANADEREHRRRLWNELWRIAAPWRGDADFSERWGFLYPERH